MEEDGGNIEHRESHASAEVGEKQLFNPGDDGRSEVYVSPDSVDDNVVTWEASEFINHQKSANWYIILTVATIALGAILYLLLRDISSPIVLAVMYLAVTVYARRTPRTLRYSVSHDGISIGEKHFDFEQFKSFSVIQETGIPNISLDPTQRFMPPVSMYFAPEDGDKIVEALAKFLPHEQKTLNPIDRAMLKLRF